MESNSSIVRSVGPGTGSGSATEESAEQVATNAPVSSEDLSGHSEHDSEGLGPSSENSSENTQPRGSVFRLLWRGFTLTAPALGAVIAITVKIGIGVLTAVFVSYLIKDGGWTQEEYSTVTGGWAVGLGLIGAALGGYLADAFGARTVILASSVILGILWIAIGTIPGAVKVKELVTGMLLMQEFMLAVLSVALFSLFMAVSWPRIAATQFTTYMALMNLSTTIGSYVAGDLSRHLAVSQIVLVAGLVQILIALPVLLIDPGQTRRVLGN